MKKANDNSPLKCCQIGCEKTAEWQAIAQPYTCYEDQVEGCSEHIGVLLWDIPDRFIVESIQKR